MIPAQGVILEGVKKEYILKALRMKRGNKIQIPPIKKLMLRISPTSQYCQLYSGVEDYKLKEMITIALTGGMSEAALFASPRLTIC